MIAKIIIDSKSEVSEALQRLLTVFGVSYELNSVAIRDCIFLSDDIIQFDYSDELLRFLPWRCEESLISDICSSRFNEELRKGVKRLGRRKRREFINSEKKRLSEYRFNYNIFAESYYSNPNQMMLVYPYFQNRLMSHSGADKEFGFREKIDWNPESYEGYELVIVTGNSETHGLEEMSIEYSISALLEDKLNSIGDGKKYKVLNCGVTGSTVMNDMTMYISILERLKPKYVVGINGFDLFLMHFVSEKLVKDHLLVYSSYCEKVIKELFHTSVPIHGEVRSVNESISSELIVDSFVYRATQFAEVVERTGDAKFIFCMQPFLTCKSKIFHNERKAFREWLLDYGSKEWFEIIRALPKIAEECSGKIIEEGKITSYTDFNQIFSHSDNEVFADWVHTNKLGNLMIAENIFNSICEKEAENA